MKLHFTIFIVFLLALSFVSCKQKNKTADMKIIFLHHSTGGVIWSGNTTSRAKKVNLPLLFEKYNKEHNRNYLIKEMIFPKAESYGWNNYPFDYYNIWIKNAGNEPYMEEPTLEILTKEYGVIIFKHCFPVSNIQADLDSADLDSNLKTLSNYKLQYSVLRNKLHEFPDTKFILFTGAVQVQSNITEAEAIRAKEFFTWVSDEWDLPDDNIYIWDLYSLQTEDGLYFKDEYAVSSSNSHPSAEFAGKAANLLFYRIIDVIENNGNNTLPTGLFK